MHGVDWTYPGHWVPVIGWVAALLFIILGVWMVWNYWRGTKR